MKGHAGGKGVNSTNEMTLFPQIGWHLIARCASNNASEAVGLNANEI